MSIGAHRISFRSVWLLRDSGIETIELRFSTCLLLENREQSKAQLPATMHKIDRRVISPPDCSVCKSF